MARLPRGVSIEHDMFIAGFQTRLAELEDFMMREVCRRDSIADELRLENEALKSAAPHAVGSLVPTGNWSTAVPVAVPVAAPVAGDHIAERLSTIPTVPKESIGSAGSVEGTSSSVERRMSVVKSLVALHKLWKQTGLAEPYIEADWYSANGLFANLARSTPFESLTLLIIVVNAIWVAVDLDYNTSSRLFEALWIFPLMESLFCAFFCCELFIRLMAYRRISFAMHDLWFLFDFFLVVLMIFETWLLQIYLQLGGRGDDGMLGRATVLRLLRLTRMARAMQAVPELKTIVRGMLAGVRSVGIIFILLSGITYVFAIILRQLTRDTEVGAVRFSSVPKACYSLLIEGLMPDNSVMMEELSHETWFLGVVFFFFILLAAWTIMNMLIGIICDVVRSVAESEEDRRELQGMTTKLERMLRSIDSFDGTISKRDFGKFMSAQETMKALSVAGVDVLALIDEVEGMFSEVPALRLSVEELAEIVGQFRSNHAATTRSIAGLRTILRSQADKSLEAMEEIRDLVKALRPNDGSLRLRSSWRSRPSHQRRPDFI